MPDPNDFNSEHARRLKAALGEDAVTDPMLISRGIYPDDPNLRAKAVAAVAANALAPRGNTNMKISEHDSKRIISKIAALSRLPDAEARCRDMQRHYAKGGSEPTAFCTEWYASLASGIPNYTIYSDDRYVPEAVACYLNYSNSYLRAIARLTLPRFDKVYDLGCGVGLTTALLAELFPDRQVIGTQVDGPQKDIAVKLGAQYGFTVADCADDCHGALVVGLDYAEHFHDPVAHFRPIIHQRPSVIALANSFAAKSIGHFDSYVIEGVETPAKKAGRAFNKWLRNCQYFKPDFGFYNDRPAVWLLKDEDEEDTQ